MRRVLSVIVLNEHGVLSRIVGLFSGRGYNIDSLTVAPLENKEFSRINIVTSGNERTFEQIVKQLHKLIPTYKVIESEEFIDKEMALVKIPLNENLGGLDAVLKAYNGTIANSNEHFLFLMVADDANRIDNFLKTIKKYNPSDIVRSGSVLMEIK
ncbi:TPA: acetolactate synthase small subunit [Campylobacter jejuni]|uniref:acetolactate synthase small subunit n=1 Tax=Campylobacter jejuni TaxID=197 RepID=UPI0012889AFD|nr:acetolactate synthase small subunit [Campylobacter jejuni]EAI1489084.1 acetolactate synthase small subunit [Campylobacter jejuni]EAJ0654945.1 acetolactate synthase small subunit [Campylobacter jejuni]EAJ6806132.1 acetolactate synthase small subunit [Campylobacter jejuni]EAK5206444.1 acetolactate synthase small subunit [Campylobacter jejuni]EHA2008216.1 acetolactate synthase small subunit [Campylobacter jejuni]